MDETPQGVLDKQSHLRQTFYKENLNEENSLHLPLLCQR